MNRIMGMDTETFVKNNSHEFISFQAFCEKPKIEKFIYKKWELEEFFDRKIKNYTFLSMMAEYDFAVLRKELTSPPFLFKMAYNNSKFVFGIIKRKNLTWRVFDLANLFPHCSLATLGNMLGLEKLEKPEYLGIRKPRGNEEWEYFEKYARRDAEISFLAGKFILEKFGRLKPTLPSLSFYLFKRDYARKGIFSCDNKAVQEKLRFSYRGGRCESFVRGTPDFEMRVYDKISLYPYVMRKYNYPLVFGHLKHKRNVNLDFEGVAKVKVIYDHEIPLLGIRKKLKDGNNKLIFPQGKFTTWLTYPELRWLEGAGLGKILKVLESYETPFRAKIFRRFIDDFYKLKEKGGREKNFYKLILNSLYGKFAQKDTKPLLILNETGKLEKEKDLKKKKHFKLSNIMISSYITAFGRIEMFKEFRKIGLENIAYTDTDSVHLLNKKIPYGRKMGKFKFVGKTSKEGNATYIRSKFYVFDNTVKCKGLLSVMKGDEMRKLIYKGKVETFSKLLLRIRAARVRHMNLLTEVFQRKNFTLGEDGKREYRKFLSDKKLMKDWTDSKAVVLNGN